MAIHAMRPHPFCFVMVMLAMLFDVSSVLAMPPLQHGFEGLTSSLRRRQNSPIPITGITNFGVQPRLEIRELEQNADQWNLFLLGFARFQQTNQSDLTSYYQIAGIHGRPWAPWDNVQPAPGINSRGYCMHVIDLFLSWHRPYLALLEQTLFQHIVDVVNEFPSSQRQRYAEAALSWRLPYWDWAAVPPYGDTVFPASLQSPTVNVMMPNGTTTIHNPLFSYQFHPISASDFYYAPFALWNETKRVPTSWDINATSQNALLVPVFENNRLSFQDRLYNLFSFYSNFTEFGDEAWIDAGVANEDSLESIHDVIHGFVGSNGHMTYFDYAAFDPSFWLHHAMVDRCFALWQAIYPDSYVEPMAAPDYSYTIQTGEVVDINTPLEPFFQDANGSFWTAASSRSVETFGYTYPELVGNNVTAIKFAINQLYGGGGASSGVSRRKARNAELSDTVSNRDSSIYSEDEVNGPYQHYLANIISRKFALYGSYAVYLFLGDYSDDASTWPASPSLVGTHTVFAPLSSTEAAGDQNTLRRSTSGVQVTGSLPLTSTLLARVQAGELRSMDPANVAEYLTENLHWRVAMFDGTDVPVEDVAGLTVTVVSAEVQPAASAGEFPKWSNFTQLTSVTKGQPGGC